MTMKSSRRRDCVSTHSALPSTACPAGAEASLRKSPPTSGHSGGPVQPGLRQSLPARNARMVGVALPTAAWSSVADDSGTAALAVRMVCVRKPAMPGYASAIRIALRPVAGPDPVSETDARTPCRGSRASPTEWTVKLVELMGAPATSSVKSGPPLDHPRPPARLSRSSTVPNGDRDQRRSATRLPSVT